VPAVLGEAKLTSFLLKVASRCNLDCDYCYVYHHADQSWRSMPKLLGVHERAAFASRLAEYVRAAELKHCVVVFHGGEPLLMGAEALVGFASQLRDAVGPDVQLDLGLQTNGLLLTREILAQFEEAKIAVSLSLDGPAEANDLHRTSKTGRSSFKKALAGLEALKSVPEVFAGVIAVIDPRIEPRVLFDFFAAHDVPKLDFLLPDAHHLRPPPGRPEQPDLYERWLLSAFDLWLDEYPQLRVRTFEALLDASAGLSSQTDAFGFGDVSLITVETDGTYHDLDVLKVVGQGATRLSGSVHDTSILEVARSPHIQTHRQLLRKEGLCKTCQQCDVVEVCGGGSLPHRHHLNGFRNPTVYCHEMRSLVRHVRHRLAQALSLDVPPAEADIVEEHPWNGEMSRFELAESALPDMTMLWSLACASQATDLRSAFGIFADSSDATGKAESADMAMGAVSERLVESLARRPGAVAWSRAMLLLDQRRAVHAVDGSAISRDVGYAAWLKTQAISDQAMFEVHMPDPWLRLPFGKSVVFATEDEARQARPVFDAACRIIEQWRPALMTEMMLACSAVQFVRDPSAHPDKIVSFSDNTVPGALFVSVHRGTDLIDPYDLADSLIHEHRHQKLYLLERVAPVAEAGPQKVKSPWREDLRPISGLFHAVFVFVELRRFWRFVLADGPAYLRTRAQSQLEDTDRNLSEAFVTLASSRLTATGKSLLAVLDAARAG